MEKSGKDTPAESRKEFEENLQTKHSVKKLTHQIELIKEENKM